MGRWLPVVAPETALPSCETRSQPGGHCTGVWREPNHGRVQDPRDWSVTTDSGDSEAAKKINLQSAPCASSVLHDLTRLRHLSSLQVCLGSKFATRKFAVRVEGLESFRLTSIRYPHSHVSSVRFEIQDGCSIHFDA